MNYEQINEVFINAVDETRLVLVTWHSTSQGRTTRVLAPLDYGPWKKSSSPEPRYHFYSSTSEIKHPISLRPEQIIEIEVLEERFSPAKIVHWVPKWHIVRDWGIFS